MPKTLLEKDYILDLEGLLDILPGLKEELLNGGLSGAMNRCLRALFEKGYIWPLKELLEILPELKERY